MAGRPGRSGGSNRLSPEEHRLRGTHNVSRHGARPAVLTMAGSTRQDPLPAAVVDGLSGRGLAFVRATWGAYDGWTPQALELLREVGFLLSQIETVRGTAEERPAQRLLLSTLAALRLEE